jgi:hypothetical protein
MFLFLKENWLLDPCNIWYDIFLVLLILITATQLPDLFFFMQITHWWYLWKEKMWKLLFSCSTFFLKVTYEFVTSFITAKWKMQLIHKRQNQTGLFIVYTAPRKPCSTPRWKTSLELWIMSFPRAFYELIYCVLKWCYFAVKNEVENS